MFQTPIMVYAHQDIKTMSNDITIEIDLDDETMVIIPDSGQAYTYDIYEVDNDIIDRLISGGADYTVYSQEETYTEDELDRDELASAVRGEHDVTPYQEK